MATRLRPRHGSVKPDWPSARARSASEALGDAAVGFHCRGLWVQAEVRADVELKVLWDPQRESEVCGCFGDDAGGILPLARVEFGGQAEVRGERPGDVYDLHLLRMHPVAYRITPEVKFGVQVEYHGLEAKGDRQEQSSLNAAVAYAGASGRECQKGLHRRGQRPAVVAEDVLLQREGEVARSR